MLRRSRRLTGSRCFNPRRPPRAATRPTPAVAAGAAPTGFNPRRPPRAATRVQKVSHRARPRRFQSTPPSEGGDPSGRRVESGAPVGVSIHAALRGRRPARDDSHRRLPDAVSIHAALRGRRPMTPAVIAPTRRRFQSTPPSEGGDPARPATAACTAASCFNPRRPRRAATPGPDRTHGRPDAVSIHAALRGRRPSRGADAIARHALQFQSTPPSEGGDPRIADRMQGVIVLFQSTPPSEGGDPTAPPSDRAGRAAVSIHAALRGRRPRHARSARPRERIVSIHAALRGRRPGGYPAGRGV